MIFSTRIIDVNPCYVFIMVVFKVFLIKVVDVIVDRQYYMFIIFNMAEGKYDVKNAF